MLAALLVSGSAAALVAPLPPTASPELAKVFKRAEFWDESETTLFDIINVLGRWDTSAQWSTRKHFSLVENPKEISEAVSATEERYAMAKRLNNVERVAMRINAPRLPFTNEKLARSVGLTVADFADRPVDRTAVHVVFDALAESKAGLIPPETADKRRAGFNTPDGGFNEGAFNGAILKARALVIFSWFLFGKGQVIGAIVFLKILSDTTGFFDSFNIPYLDWIVFSAALLAGGRAALQQDDITFLEDAKYTTVNPFATASAAWTK